MHFSRPAPNTQNKMERSKDTVIQQTDTIYTPSKTESKRLHRRAIAAGHRLTAQPHCRKTKNHRHLYTR